MLRKFNMAYVNINLLIICTQSNIKHTKQYNFLSSISNMILFSDILNKDYGLKKIIITKNNNNIYCVGNYKLHTNCNSYFASSSLFFLSKSS